MNMETFVQQLGFTDLDEFNRMVASVDLSTADEQRHFSWWKEHDGTKHGLQMLLDAQAERKQQP